MVGSRFVDLEASDKQPFLPRSEELDITSKDSVADYLSKHRDEIKTIVNFAAFTDVGEAENQRGDKKGDCWQINVEGAINLTSAIKDTDIRLIQISTDMVFSGSKDDPGPYTEERRPEKDPDKVTWYGFTKGEGERIITKELGEKATILRIIYPVRAHFKKKLDYLRFPLKLFDEEKLYPVFTDQQVSISFIDEVCKALVNIIDEKQTGVFHAGSSDIGTPFEIISYLIEKARDKRGVVKKTTLEEFITTTNASPIRYPKFGGLSVSKTEEKLGIEFSTWKQIVEKIASELGNLK